MKYKRFEDLPFWQATIELSVAVLEFTNSNYRLFLGAGDARNQLERALISISNNVAEGFERGSTAELIQFLYIARGSAGEARSVILLCSQLTGFRDHSAALADYEKKLVNISAQLCGWIGSLKSTEIKGQKFLKRVNHEKP